MPSVEEAEEPCLWLWLRLFSVPCLVTVVLVGTPPGRWFVRNRFRWPVNNRIGWCLKELPSLLIPIWHLSGQTGPLLRPPLLPLSLFAAHYFQRTFIYPLRMSADSARPLPYILMAAAFTTWNGQLQSLAAHRCPADSSDTYTTLHAVGAVIFVLGAAINIDSDQRLLALRKPGGPRYCVPHGGFFEFVTAANYLGEMIEWWGYALVSWTPAALFFALFTTVYLTGCAAELHEQNKARFGAEYPRERRRIVPFLF
ncbi:3-oxo-5-alpha-steroid 4-dehydrogenase 1-like [Pollicipes pollicipes]|uniref:3-oxo-5-alpha-steroid 4-dehydrogenase 1-like n=1 Tax=Pollicipes pollicipes TaxID=41117 RepID=UPI001884D7E6|nr:3-oxo-5-alpha-steroid 4-dehydrogenase 1-like [Pollicipes pollicipes]